MNTHRRANAISQSKRLVLSMLALFLCGLIVVSCSNSNPVDGQLSPSAPTDDFNDPVDDIEYSDPSQVQVLQVWCVYEFDTDACVELEADYGHNADDNFGIDPAINAASIDELTAQCGGGAGDRVACAELAKR